MEIRYCPDDQFVANIKTMNAELIGVEGHMRWQITTDEGEKFILRPESTKPTDDN